MTKLKQNILYKLSFDSIPIGGELPTNNMDDGKYKLPYTKGGVIKKYVENDKSYIEFINTVSKLLIYNIIDSNAFTFNTSTLQIDLTISTQNYKAETCLWQLATSTNATQFRVSIINNNSITMGTPTAKIVANYNFVDGTIYHISVSKSKNIYVIYINGVPVGCKVTESFNPGTPSTSTLAIGHTSNTITTASSAAFAGRLYSANVSVGPSLINDMPYTKYGYNMISRLNMLNNITADTPSTLNMPIETIHYSPLDWVLPSGYTINRLGYYISGTTGLTTPIDANNFTVTYNIDGGVISHIELNPVLFSYNSYKLYVQSYLSDDTNTVINRFINHKNAALTFENNSLIDATNNEIIWDANTSSITDINTIAGEYSLQNSTSNESGLSTLSSVISGGSLPFTIQFKALIKDVQAGKDANLISQNINAANGSQLVGLSRANGFKPFIVRESDHAQSFDPIYGRSHIKYNDINEYTLSYDGSALRLFINNKFECVVPTQNGWNVSQLPLSFLKNITSNNINDAGYTNAIIDDINIYDGVAVQTKEYDPYEEYLVCDIPGIGVDNSTNFVDNANAIYNKITSLNTKLSITDNTIDPAYSWNVSNALISNNAVRFIKSVNRSTLSYELASPINVSDFILTFKFKLDNITSDHTLLDMRSLLTQSSSELLVWTNGGMLCLYINGQNVLSSDNVLKPNIYYQVSIIRDSGLIRVILDSTEIGQYTYPTALVNTTLYFGHCRNANQETYTYDLSGSIKDINLYIGITGSDNVTIYYKRKWNGTAVLSSGAIQFNQTYVRYQSIVGDAFNFYGDFTLQCEFATSLNTRRQVLMDRYFSAFGQWQLSVTTSGKIAFTHGFNAQMTIQEGNINGLNNGVYHKVVVVRSGINIYIIVDGILDIVFQSEHRFYASENEPITFGLQASSATSYRLNGRIKNIKIYNGVSILDSILNQDKTSLTFDNGITDDFNTIWTDSGDIIFDPVNSGSGNAAILSSGKYIATTSNRIKFGQSPFTLSFAYKEFAKSQNDNFIISNNIQNTSPGSLNIHTTTDNKIAMAYYNPGYVYKKLIAGQSYNNIDYTVTINRTGNTVYAIQNDAIVNAVNMTTETFDFNNGGAMRIGEPSTDFKAGYPYESFNGVIDNFRSYKYDPTHLDDLTIFTSPTNFDRTFSIVDGGLRLSSTVTSDANVMYYLNDSPVVNSFIGVIVLFLKNSSPNYGGITFRTTYFNKASVNYMGYCAYVTGSNIRFGRGSNTSTTNAWTQLANYAIPSSYLNNNYHELKIDASGNVFNIYLDGNLIITVEDSTHQNISSRIGIPTYFYGANVTSQIKSISIYSQLGNLLYTKDFGSNSKLPGKPALYLPMETNYSNLGYAPTKFVPITTNYSMQAGDSSRSINMSQHTHTANYETSIFDFGKYMDFHLEMDAYILGYGTVIIDTRNSSTTNGYQLYLTSTYLQIYMYGGYDYLTLNITAPLNQWVKIKLTRLNGKLTLSLNDFSVSDYIVRDLACREQAYIGMQNNSNYVHRGNLRNLKVWLNEMPNQYYSDYNILDIDFAPTGKSYLFNDKCNTSVLHPINIDTRAYENGKYGCRFNGTDQFIKIESNDRFNFGNDNFVISIDFNIDEDSTNEYASLLACGTDDPSNKNGIMISPTGDITIIINNTIITNAIMIQPGEDTNFIIRRNNGILDVYINNELVLNSLSADFKFDMSLDNTYIGRNTWGGSAGYFKGVIYEVKILRNTSNIAQLQDVILTKAEGAAIALTNGVDEVVSNIYGDISSVHIMKDNNNVNVKINNTNIMTIPATAFNASPNMTILKDYTGTLKDVTVYDTAFIDNDTFEYDGPYDISLCELEDAEDDEDDEELIADDVGDYMINGYIEGAIAPRRLEMIYTPTNSLIAVFNSINYQYGGIDKRFLSYYALRDVEKNIDYPIEEMGPPGTINVNIAINLCSGSDLYIRLYRRDTGRLVGEYEIDKMVDPYQCVIPNLDTTKKYDVMLFDRNNNIESRMMSNRSPE